ncbi:unnamed protein product [Caretta caretta]
MSWFDETVTLKQMEEVTECVSPSCLVRSPRAPEYPDADLDRVIQETHTAPAVEASWWLEWGDEVYFSHLSARSAGVAILFSPELRPKVLGVAEVVPGHLLHIQACVEGLILNQVNIYDLNAGPERVLFYWQASAFLGTLDPHECMFWAGISTPPSRTGTTQESRHPRQPWASSGRSWTITPWSGTTTTRTMLSRLPMSSLLEDVGFVASFWEFWLAWRGQRRAFPLARQWWDVGKVHAWLFFRDYTRGATWQRDAVIGQLEREVLELERRLASGPEDPPRRAAYREKWEELWALEDHRARGAFIRSRIRLLREMDCSSRFYYAVEKRKGAKKHVTCLLVEDVTPLTDPEKMRGRARAFYASLFSPDPTNTEAHRVLWTELPTVSVGDRDRLELSLSLAKLSEALCCMPTNKSPGMNGLTVEFYGVFWDVLSPGLVIVWAETLQSGVLPLSCSTDYKVAAKAISLRLGSVLADVVHPDQTYTVQGRTIFNNLYLVQDLLELGSRGGLSFALLSLDQEKAFDRVDHEYLLGTLRAFSFRTQFMGFLQVLYTDAECLVRLNWTLTKPVSFGQGRLTGLVLREPELRLVLSVYANDVLLVIQDPDDLVWVEACQAVYSAASSTRVNWVKSSGLVVGDGWQPSSGAGVHCSILAFIRHASFSARELVGFGGQGG